MPWGATSPATHTSDVIGSRPLELTGTAQAKATEPSVPVSLLSALADPVRWTVLRRLSDGPACVCDLQEHAAVAPNLLSYHLKVLREAGLVTSSRRGRWIDYTLAEDTFERLIDALPVTKDGLRP